MLKFFIDFFTIPLFIDVFILTIHDLVFKVFPKTINKGRKFYYNKIISSSIKRSNGIIAVSKSTLIDLEKYYNVEGKYKTVIYEGLNFFYNKILKEEYTLKEYDYFLFVGTIEPRKNLTKLIEAFNKFKKLKKSNIKLVIVGAKGWKNSKIHESVVKFKLEDDICFKGYISENELLETYSKAKAFFFVSLYEGFGLPILEAMSLKVPVVASNVSTQLLVMQQYMQIHIT